MADKIISSDIYDIADFVDSIKKNYIEDETEDTLMMGIYGYMSAIFSNELQNASRIASQYSNEAIPTKAKFEKNIIAHAIIQNITDIQATPAKMSVMLGITMSDLDELFRNDVFRFDRQSKIFVNYIEYHLQYDIVLSRTLTVNNQMIYSARYDMSIDNPLSDITNPYLKTPFLQFYGGQEYLFIYCDIMQISMKTVQSKLITSTPIENKVFEFEFEEQLASFKVKVTENDKTTYLTPVFEGIGVKQDLTDFCYYSYIDLNNIRVTFDSISYLPGINALIEAEIWTTLGSEGNFSFFKNFNTTLSSDN